MAERKAVVDELIALGFLHCNIVHQSISQLKKQLFRLTVKDKINNANPKTIGRLCKQYNIETSRKDRMLAKLLKFCQQNSDLFHDDFSSSPPEESSFLLSSTAPGDTRGSERESSWSLSASPALQPVV